MSVVVRLRPHILSLHDRTEQLMKGMQTISNATSESERMADIFKQNQQLKTRIKDVLEYVYTIVETIRQPLLVLSTDLKILTANSCFYQIFSMISHETIGHLIYDLGNRQWDIPTLHVLFEEMLPNNAIINDFVVDLDFPGVGRKIIRINARQISQKIDDLKIILLAMEDVTLLNSRDRGKKLSVTTAFNEIIRHQESEYHHFARNPAILTATIDGFWLLNMRGDFVEL